MIKGGGGIKVETEINWYAKKKKKLKYCIDSIPVDSI